MPDYSRKSANLEIGLSSSCTELAHCWRIISGMGQFGRFGCPKQDRAPWERGPRRPGLALIARGQIAIKQRGKASQVRNPWNTPQWVYTPIGASPVPVRLARSKWRKTASPSFGRAMVCAIMGRTGRAKSGCAPVWAGEKGADQPARIVRYSMAGRIGSS